MSQAELAPLPPRDAIEALAARGGRLDPSFSWLDVWQEEHTRAFTVAKSAGYDILSDIHAALLKALEEGRTFAQFADELRPRLEEKGWWGHNEVVDPLTGERRAVRLGSMRRLQTIFETNMRVSYAVGHWARFERDKAARPFLRYVAILDEATRPKHRALHNLVLPVNHPFWSRWAPPNGWGCRCTLQQLSQRDVDRLIAEGEDLRFEPPQLGERSFTNRRTGEVSIVPDGIDPGWAYNPGREGFARIERALQDKLDRGLLFDSLPRQWPPVPATDAELRLLADQLAEEQAGWEESLKPDELEAIASYKGAGHAAANALLRRDALRLEEFDEEDLEAAQLLIDDFSAALARARFPRAVTTFRGVPPEVAERIYSGLKRGDMLTDEGFVSSSLSNGLAYGFGDFLIEFRLPRGAPAIAFVHFIPGLNHVEYEVVLAPNTRMRVIERRADRLIVEVIRK